MESEPLHRPEPERDDERLVAELTEHLAELGDLEGFAERFALLADPGRLRILSCLHAHPGVRSSDIARVLGASESRTSHALGLLRAAGWVRAERRGREVRYELVDDMTHRILHEIGFGHLPGVSHVDRSA